MEIKKRQKYYDQHHSVVSGGLPSNYYQSPTLLFFNDLTTTDVFTLLLQVADTIITGICSFSSSLMVLCANKKKSKILRPTALGFPRRSPIQVLSEPDVA